MVEVSAEFLEHAPKVTLGQDEQVVETLFSHRADPALGEGIRVG
jgi:hypothetical protein